MVELTLITSPIHVEIEKLDDPYKIRLYVTGERGKRLVLGIFERCNLACDESHDATYNDVEPLPGERFRVSACAAKREYIQKALSEIQVSGARIVPEGDLSKAVPMKTTFSPVVHLTEPEQPSPR